MEFNERLYQAIRKDDIKEFNSCMETSNCGPLRLGRFPVLSVMYLYNSRRILRAYEKAFIKLNSWKDIGEPLELSGMFRTVAGKCLRIYLNEIVTPIEMLLLLDNNAKVRKVFQQSHVAPPVRQRLKDIYYVRWGLTADFVRNKIVLQRRPLTGREIKQWLVRLTCAVLCLALIVSSPFIVNTFLPFISDADGVLNVVSWSQIRFKSNETYVLNKDVTVPARFFAKEMNCTLIGNGHTVTVLGDGLFGNLNGKIADVTFVTNGSPVVQVVNIAVNGKGEVQTNAENVTVNATLSMTTDSPVGLFANENYGIINNVTVNASGSITAVAPDKPEPSPDDSDEENTSIHCGGIVAVNHYYSEKKSEFPARVQNCIANFDNLTLTGVEDADFIFGGVVGLNDAHVIDCEARGSITADTFDLAGICAENSYGVIRCVNNANVSQSTDSTQWSPLVAGVVATNNFKAEVYNCVNLASVQAEGKHAVRAGGIVAYAEGGIYSCRNTGNLSVQSDVAFVGGIVAYSCAGVVECYSAGDIQVSAVECDVGGIVGCAFGRPDVHVLYLGSVSKCISENNVTVMQTSSDGFVSVGGIVGYAQEWQLNHGTDPDTKQPVYSYASADIVNCFFTGALAATSASADTYVGGIAGIVGKRIYLLCGTDDTYLNGNVYLSGCGANSAYGAVLVRENSKYEKVTDAGARVASMQEIAESEIYQEILDFFKE